MARSKGTGISLIRRMFQSLGKEREAVFLRQLTEKELEIYSTASPISWVLVEQLTSVFFKAAQVLFPGVKNALQHFSKLEAKDHLRGIYRLLLPFVNIQYLITKTARLWDTYYDKGQARSEWFENEKKAVLIVEGFPDLPVANRRDIVTGYLYGTLELTGVRNVLVKFDESDPQCWKWIVTWN